MQTPFPFVTKWLPQPLDRVAVSLILGLGLLTGLLLWGGDQTLPRVRDFNWQNQQIGATDTTLTLNFNRPMDWDSVTDNLEISPPLPGKFSWAGRRLAYTLSSPAPYGTRYQLRLAQAQDNLPGEVADPKPMQPFSGHFRSRDRAFVYLGTSGQEAGRLILYNFTRQQKRVLTPKDLVVAEFKFYPNRDRILFSATDRKAQAEGGMDPQLYTVTTGIELNAPGQSSVSGKPAGRVKRILDNRNFQLLAFDLAADGQTIVLQRASRKDPQQSTLLWIMQPNTSPEALEGQTGGSFLITPDSQSLVIAQGQGLSVLPLDSSQDSQALDFLPQYGKVLSFAQDGGAAAMVKYNPDYTRSLYWITNQGVQKQLFKTTGSILDAQFDPGQQTLYCLLTKLLPSQNQDYNEIPYLAKIDLKTAQLTPLLELPGQRNLQMSLAPDGSGILFDQVISTSQPATSPVLTDQGETILTSRLWLLPLPSAPKVQDKKTQTQPQAIPLSGFHPQWLP